MAGTKTLHRLEKKFSFLQQKQEQTMAKIRQEMKRTKKEIEAKRLDFIAQTIKETGFPIDKTVLLIGAVLDAKGKIEGSESTSAINRYIELYNEFAEKHGIPISSAAKRYSMDANMLHTSFEGSELEDPGSEPHESCYERFYTRGTGPGYA